VRGDYGHLRPHRDIWLTHLPLVHYPLIVGEREKTYIYYFTPEHLRTGDRRKKKNSLLLSAVVPAPAYGPRGGRGRKKKNVSALVALILTFGPISGASISTSRLVGLRDGKRRKEKKEGVGVWESMFWEPGHYAGSRHASAGFAQAFSEGVAKVRGEERKGVCSRRRIPDRCSSVGAYSPPRTGLKEERKGKKKKDRARRIIYRIRPLDVPWVLGGEKGGEKKGLFSFFLWAPCRITETWPSEQSKKK